MRSKALPLARLLVAAAFACSPGALALASSAAAAGRTSHKQPAKHHKSSVGFSGPFHYVGIASAPNGSGDWVATSHGNVFQKGKAPFYGSPVASHDHLNTPVVAIASTSSVHGYWLVTASGRVFAYGKAHNHGSLKEKPASPIVAIGIANGGGGYWLVSASGKVYRFGNARRLGSLKVSKKERRVVSIIVTGSSRGYWLVTANGGVFRFGSAHFYGSLAGKHLTSPVVSAAVPSNRPGYWLTTANGGVFNFGKAGFKGSEIHSRHGSPITAIATDGGPGYWLLRANGKVERFGKPVHIVPPPNPNADPLKHGSLGYDVSWPQCGATFNNSNAVEIVGINDGRAFTTNPCLSVEWHRAQSSPHPMVYVNTDNPGLQGAAAFRYGEQAAQSSLNTAASLKIESTVWWLDVETTNEWDDIAPSIFEPIIPPATMAAPSEPFTGSPFTTLSGSPLATPLATLSGAPSGNAEVILGFIHQLKLANRVVGIYSTGFQWGEITSDYHLSTPVPQWIPGAPSFDMAGFCASSERFAPGTIWMTQSDPDDLDIDYAC